MLLFCLSILLFLKFVARLLNERQDQAAHLQMQCNQVVKLPSLEIQELRAEIKVSISVIYSKHYYVIMPGDVQVM